MSDDPHAPLREDVRLLGELLGQTLRTLEGQALFDGIVGVAALVGSHRSAAKARASRANGRLGRRPRKTATTALEIRAVTSGDVIGEARVRPGRSDEKFSAPPDATAPR